jgi:hypothetical protein
MPKPPVGKVVGRAVFGPLNVTVLGAGIAGAFALGLWPLAALGGVAYAALVATDVANPQFWRKHVLGRGGDGADVMPRPDRIGDAETRKAAEGIATATGEIEQLAKQLPERVMRNVRRTLDGIDEMKRHAAKLVVRADELSRYLATIQWAEAEAEAAQLEARAADAGDAASREQYQLAAEAAAERLRALRDVRIARARSLANLSRIGAALRSIPAKLMRVRALDDQASDALTGDVGTEVDRMNVELTAFEQTLADLVGGTLQEIA